MQLNRIIIQNGWYLFSFLSYFQIQEQNKEYKNKGTKNRKQNHKIYRLVIKIQNAIKKCITRPNKVVIASINITRERKKRGVLFIRSTCCSLVILLRTCQIFRCISRINESLGSTRCEKFKFNLASGLSMMSLERRQDSRYDTALHRRPARLV